MSAVPMPKDGYKAFLLKTRQDLAKSLQWHTLKKIKVDIPDLKLIEDKNKMLKDKAEAALQFLEKNLANLKTSHIELSRTTYETMLADIKAKNELIDQLKTQLRIRGRNESIELHSSVTNSVKRRLSSLENVSELRIEMERRSRLCEQIDAKLKETEKMQIKEREAAKAKFRQCKQIIEGLTERVRSLKKEVTHLKENQVSMNCKNTSSHLNLDYAQLQSKYF